MMKTKTGRKEIKNSNPQKPILLIGISFATSLTAQTQFLIPAVRAADFSKAQHTYAPPSQIRYDLDALGTNNWTFPGLDSNTTSSINPDTPTAGKGGPGIGTMLSGSEGAAGNQSGQVIYGSSGSAFHAPFTYSGSKNAWQKYQNSLTVSTQINKINAKINALRKDGNLAQAEALSRDGLRYFPNNATLKKQFVEITTLEAQHSLTAQDTDSAGIKAREALACDPTYTPAKIVDSRVLQLQGFDPNSAEVRATVGDNLANDGRVLEALVEYRTSLNIKSNAPGHVGLGNLAFGKGLMTEATRQYERALAIDPQSSLAYRQRGALRYVMHDAIGANSDFNKAVSLNPNDRLAGEALVGLWKQQVANNANSVNGHLGLARAYLQTNNLEAARGEYKTVVGLDPNNPALTEARNSFKVALAKQQAYQSVQAAKTLDSQGAVAEANQKLSEALSYYPNDPQILLYQGQLNEKLGLPAQAHDSYMSVLRLDPHNLEAAKRLKALSGQNGLSAAPAMFMSMPQSTPQSMPQSMPQSAPSLPMSSPPVAPSRNNAWPVNTPILKPTTIPSVPVGTPAPVFPENDSIFNTPLKAPITKSQINPLNETVVVNLDEVTMLSNFASSVRALILSEELLLKLAKQNGPSYEDANTSRNEAHNQAHSQESRLSDLGFLQ